MAYFPFNFGWLLMPRITGTISTEFLCISLFHCVFACFLNAYHFGYFFYIYIFAVYVIIFQLETSYLTLGNVLVSFSFLNNHVKRHIQWSWKI